MQKIKCFLVLLVIMEILAFNDLQSAGIRELFELQLEEAHNILEVNFTRDSLTESNDAIVVLLTKDQKLSDLDNPFVSQYSEIFEKFLQNEKFVGKKNETALLPIIHNNKYIKVFFFGLGAVDSLELPYFETIGKRLYNILYNKKIKDPLVFFKVNGCAKDFASKFSMGASLNKFRFDLKTKKKDEDESKEEKDYKGPTKIDLLVPDNLNDKDIVDLKNQYNTETKGLIEAINVTKVYCDGPPNLIYPESLSKYIESDLKKVGNSNLSIEILDKKKMLNLGMGALLGVAQGSINDPKFMVLKYYGGKNKSEAPLVFVGKGVTFDSGGLSIKPADSMEGMKYDMSGAATVAGLLRTLAFRKANVNAIGIMPIVENSVGDNAQRPGDIVRSMSGLTIEVLNTDAEGRLILADALTYAQVTFKPKLIIDLATLTGAVIVALGTNTYPGLMSNNDTISSQLIESGKKMNESVWRLPLGEDYNKKMDSKIADMQNIGNSKGWGAGTITAAEFLQRFINKGTVWAHLDIAGVDNRTSGNESEVQGSVAFGIKLLNDFVKHYE